MLRQMFFRTKKAFLCLTLLVCSVVSSAQDLKVVSFEQTIEAYASINKRLDGNDVPCAVLKISIPDAKDFSFESGMRIGDVIYNPGEAIVYLASGARNITIKSDKYGVLKYTFPDRTKLEKLVTYRLTVKIPSLGIGGRKVAFGVSGGYILPIISTSSKGTFTGSVVNYALGNGTENASYSSSGGFSVGAHVDFRIWRSFHLITGVNFLQYKYSNEFDGDVEYISMVAGVDYVDKGITQNSYKEKYSMSTLEIPVLFSYRLPVTQKSHVQFNVGPVINYGLSAKLDLSGSTDSELLYRYKVIDGNITNQRYDNYKYVMHYLLNGDFDLYSKKASWLLINQLRENDEKPMAFEDVFEESPLNRLNFGVQVGIAYEYEGFLIGLEYNMMFSNMANKKYWEGSRWAVFNDVADNLMLDYKQRNSFLKFSLGYTFRY